MFKLISDHGDITCELVGKGSTIIVDIICGMHSVISKLNESDVGKEVVKMLEPQFAHNGAIFSDEAFKKLGEKGRDKTEEPKDALEELKKSLLELLNSYESEEDEDDSE